ncbi:MAG: ATP-binding protein [Spirochaetia bacterium]|nr:ATP-binding protein [Spirochaetia bacterium]
MIPRQAADTLKRLEKGFPVLCITGPRQSGKTTLAKACYPKLPYLSLEDPDIARLAREDPRGLLDTYRDGLILDEAQAVPEIFAYLKTAVDADPRPGKYIVTGSRQFGLLAGVTESLAGRAAFLTLLPFSVAELKTAGKLPADPFKTIVKGFYPPIYDRNVSPYDWYTNYIASYVERDVRSIINVKDLGQFQTFVKMCASRVGQLLNLSALALDCGVSHNTARSWLSVLETSGIVYLLKPYHQNFGKRLVKSPKLYFVDTGLATRLLGIKTAEELFVHPNRGNLFECFVVAELLKARYSAGVDPGLYFWRDNIGTEVDIVFDEGQKQKVIEVKSGKTFSPEFATALESWMRFADAKAEDCALIYAGDRTLQCKGISVVPWNVSSALI